MSISVVRIVASSVDGAIVVIMAGDNEITVLKYTPYSSLTSTEYL